MWFEHELEIEQYISPSVPFFSPPKQRRPLLRTSCSDFRHRAFDLTMSKSSNLVLFQVGLSYRRKGTPKIVFTSSCIQLRHYTATRCFLDRPFVHLHRVLQSALVAGVSFVDAPAQRPVENSRNTPQPELYPFISMHQCSTLTW